MKLAHAFYSILLIIAFTGCQTETKKPKVKPSKEIKVATQKMTHSEEVQTYSYSGQIEASKNIRLSFQLPGKVTKINVEEGDRIKAGQVLAELDNSRFQSAYDAALASHHQAEDAYNRLKKVYNNGSLPEVDWEDVKTKKAQSQAALELSEQNLKDCKLVSPTSGIIGERNLEVGVNASPNLPVFNLLKMEEVYVKIAVPENEINKFKKGQQATLVVAAIGSQKFQAKVEKIGVTANLISRTYEVKLLILNQPDNIKPGMLCDVIVYPEIKEQVFSLPINAVLKDDSNRNFVYTVNTSNQTAWPRYVKVDGFSNNEVKIVSGLKANDIVVISGQHKLSPNTKVRI